MRFFLNESQRIIIYGAGYCGLMFSELLEDIGIRPICFFDKSENKMGRKFNGINVCKPVLMDENDCVIVAILDKNGYPGIFSYLSELGYKNIRSIYDFCEEEALFRNQKLIFYVPDDWKDKNERQLLQVVEALEDELSKKTYLSIIESITGNTEVEIPHASYKEQYFAYDVYHQVENEVFLDCGAFRGDILKFFTDNVKGRFKQYIAIEPDPENYIRIEQSDEAKDVRVQIMKCALSDREESLRIQNYLNENSVIEKTGREVEASTLDEICMRRSIKPTFIKVDVEGYEQKLLDGAKCIMNECQPIIAIAIYHKANDLWEIPLRIKRMLPNHRLFIRSYMNVNETILYAVPKERCVL